MMKFANPIFFSLITIMFLASGCTKSNQPSIPDDSDQAVANVVPAINGGANAANSQSGAISKMFRANRSERIAEVFKNLFFNPAQATVGCGQFAVQDTCSGGVKQAIYPTLSNCSVPGGIIAGTITLTYSQAACTMSVANDTLTRTANVVRTGLLGAALITDSVDTSTAYDGTAIGAGATLTATSTANSYTYAIAGVHKTRQTYLSIPQYDVNVMTTSPMTLTGPLSGNRVVDGGTVVLYHNILQYTATFSPHSLQYNSATCCHPMGGSLDVSYTGSITGTGSVTFDSNCGEAILSMNGLTETIELLGCE